MVTKIVTSMLPGLRVSPCKSGWHCSTMPLNSVPTSVLVALIPRPPFYLLLPVNKVWGKVMFSEVCVKNSVHRGSTWACTPPGPGVSSGTPGTRYTPTGAGTPPRPGTPPRTRYTPLGPGTSPEPGTSPGPGTPPWDQVHPLNQVHPLDQVHPPGIRYTPQEQCMPGVTGKKWALPEPSNHMFAHLNCY